MSRILAHVIPDGHVICTICGTTAVQAASGYTCIWRDTDDPRHSTMLPEPARRQLAHLDPSIAGRIAELEAERRAAWNATEPVDISVADGCFY